MTSVVEDRPIEGVEYDFGQPIKCASQPVDDRTAPPEDRMVQYARFKGDGDLCTWMFTDGRFDYAVTRKQPMKPRRQ